MDAPVPSPDPNPDVSGMWLGSDRRHKTKIPSRPRDKTRCCSSRSVQLTFVLARVPSVLGGGLLSHCPLVQLSTAVLEKPRRAGPGRPLGGLRSTKKPKNPESHVADVLTVQRQLSLHHINWGCLRLLFLYKFLSKQSSPWTLKLRFKSFWVVSLELVGHTKKF